MSGRGWEITVVGNNGLVLDILLAGFLYKCRLTKYLRSAAKKDALCLFLYALVRFRYTVFCNKKAQNFRFRLVVGNNGLEPLTFSTSRRHSTS